MKEENILKLDPGAIEEASAMVSRTVMEGGVVLYPSDTVYGLMCRADMRKSVERIRRIKGWEAPRPFIVLVTGIHMAHELSGCDDPEVDEIMKLRWPGKLTLILPASEKCPPWVTDGGDGTIALRHPAGMLSGMIIKACGVPLVSTSANRAGGRECLSFLEVPERIRAEVDLAVDAGILPVSYPSTVLRLVRGRKGPTPSP